MRLCALVLAALLAVFALALGGDGAAHIVQLSRPSSISERPFVLEAGLVCGMFDGRFTCKNATGGAQHGKNAIPGVPVASPEAVPEGVTGGNAQDATGTGNTGQGMPGAAESGCQGGMVGTPPDCQCPKNSELLGGNCVHYTATCSNGLSADSLPQPCQKIDEKLACKMRQDGLKDCCCLLYDKL